MLSDLFILIMIFTFIILFALITALIFIIAFSILNAIKLVTTENMSTIKTIIKLEQANI